MSVGLGVGGSGEGEGGMKVDPEQRQQRTGQRRRGKRRKGVSVGSLPVRREGVDDVPYFAETHAGDPVRSPVLHERRTRSKAGRGRDREGRVVRFLGGESRVGLLGRVGTVCSKIPELDDADNAKGGE